MIDTFEDSEHIAYLQNVTSRQIERLTVQEAKIITYQLSKVFLWKKTTSNPKKRSIPKNLPSRKTTKVKLSELAPEETKSHQYNELLELEYLESDFIEELMCNLD